MFAGIGQLANKVWNEIFSISIPFVGITFKQMLIGIFVFLTGVGVFKRIFQGLIPLSDTSEIRNKVRYGNQENRKGKVSNRRRNDEI